MPFRLASRLAIAAFMPAFVASTAFGQQPSKADFVSVTDLDSLIVLDMRYATTDNFVGRMVDGYESATCLLSRPAAEALAKVSRDLVRQGYRVIVYDCYRPQRAVDHFVRWSRYPLDQSTKSEYYPHVDKRRLFALGYISSRSGHSRGSTVDLGLAAFDPDTGQLMPVDMGTPFDFFDPLSHTATEDISSDARTARYLLKAVMSRHGFRNYPKEWWHYTLVGEPYPETYFDFPVRQPVRRYPARWTGV